MPGGQHPPLSIILSWPKKGTVSASDSARHGTVVWLCVLLGLSVLAMAARMRARSLRRNYGMDDWLLLASLVPTIGMVVVSSLGLEKYGFGKHIWDLDITTLIEARKVVFATEITFLWASSLIKLSILSFYTRLARDSMTSRYIAMVRASMAFIVVYLCTFTVVLCLTCRPFSAFWTQIYEYILPKRDFTCVDEGASLLWNTGISVIQDFLTTILPFTLFWSLALPSRQKMALGAIFALGFLVCITGVMRFYYLYVMYYQTYDVTYVARDTLAWTSTELLVGTICASAPALKIYFRTLLPSHPTNNDNSNQPPSTQAKPPAPTLLSFHQSHRRHSRNMQQSSSLWRKTQDSFVRLDDNDEESFVGIVGIARTTESHMPGSDIRPPPPSLAENEKTAVATVTPQKQNAGISFLPDKKTNSSLPTVYFNNSPMTTTKASTEKIGLYWPTSRSWSEKIDGIGSVLGSETELSDIVCSSPTSSSGSMK